MAVLAVAAFVAIVLVLSLYLRLRGRRTELPRDPDVQRILDEIKSVGIDEALRRLHVPDGLSRLHQELWARVYGAKTDAAVVLAISQEKVWVGPGTERPGHHQFVRDVLEKVLREPIREVMLTDASWRHIATMDDAERQHVANVLAALAAVRDVRRAAEERVDRALWFDVPETAFRLRVARSAGGVLVRIVDVRSAEKRIADLCVRFRRRGRLQGGRGRWQHARFRTRPRIQISKADRHLKEALSDAVLDGLEGWLDEITGPQAHPAELGLPEDPPPTLWATCELGPAHAPAVAGIVQAGAQQAVVLVSHRGFQLRIGYSTPRHPFWEDAVKQQDQSRFLPGEPQLEESAPEFGRRWRRWGGALALVLLQVAAGIQEVSNSGNTPQLVHQARLSSLALAVGAVFIPVGQLISGFVAKRLMARGVGTRPLVIAAAVAYCGLTFSSLAHAGTVGVLWISFGWLLFGLGNGPADVSIMVLANRLKQGDARTQYASLGAAAFTFASIAAAAANPIFVAHGVHMTPHLAGVWLVGVALTMVAVAVTPNLRQRDVAVKVKSRGWDLAKVMAVSAIGLMPLGATYLWGPLVAERLGASAVVATIATLAFTVAQGVLQLGALLVPRVNPRRVVFRGAIATFAGAAAIVVAVYTPHLPSSARIALALAAFGAVGAGLALPAALLQHVVAGLAEQSGRNAEQALATLTVANYTALGLGQVVQGLLASVMGGLLGAAAGIPLSAAALFAVAGVVMVVFRTAVPKR